MANTNAPFGFRAQPPLYGLLPFAVVAAGNTQAVYRGDAMALESNGGATSDSDGVVMLIGAVEGIAQAARITFTKALLAADTAGTVLLHYHMNQKYLVQGDVTTPTRTMIGNNGDHANGTGSTVTGLSGHYLVNATLNTTTYGWRLLDLFNGEGNDTTAAYCKFLVLPNEHFMSSTTGV